MSHWRDILDMEDKMILCHKCSGLLTRRENEDSSGLRHCRCISGWVRGTEPELDKTTAAIRQVESSLFDLVWYRKQGRSQAWLDGCRDSALRSLQAVTVEF